MDDDGNRVSIVHPTEAALHPARRWMCPSVSSASLSCFFSRHLFSFEEFFLCQRVRLRRKVTNSIIRIFVFRLRILHSEEMLRADLHAGTVDRTLLNKKHWKFSCCCAGGLKEHKQKPHLHTDGVRAVPWGKKTSFFVYKNPLKWCVSLILNSVPL